ncbi:MAG: hypothetical protein DYG89_54880, partial [Caldilinea sp. CFX5]|nr:hypothetical protein [Caldilinea sp. CFX5]
MMTYGEAIKEAIAEEMRRDSRVFIIGEDVAEAGTPFKVLLGLVDEFGTQRVIDSPISEAGVAGIGVGDREAVKHRSENARRRQVAIDLKRVQRSVQRVVQQQRVGVPKHRHPPMDDVHVARVPRRTRHHRPR